MSKEYLGDSVSVDFDDLHLVLTTKNGDGPILLNRSVYLALVAYHKRLVKRLKQAPGDVK